MLSGNYRIVMVEASREAYSYKDVPTLCTGVDEARLSRAIDFGTYPTWLILAFKLAADRGDRFAEVVG